jgi:hypothetical protein
MTNREASLIKSFALFGVIIIFSVIGVVFYQTNTAQRVHATNGIARTDSSHAIPTPVVSETDTHSSNADKKLILRTRSMSDGTTEYTYFVADISGANQRIMFDKTLPTGASMTLPRNSWDPTDTYVFLEEHNSGVVDYLVLKVDGTSFADGNHYIDVGAVWANKNVGYTIRTATGWASGTLLIIYTSNTDGTHGPAFWFEIPSTAIIQLAS